ncbi:uncharacterized protein LOC117168767 [Belonocnema kinseyi]|uniref:uncharacterized protein LOC117168767 n=1 Tax=Belonocnema kinseyi TaxID=2817044 RepID=UPI00143D1A0C|nr:uncharacterized protein LOC117168767 [Belonocnema kinseyi]
MKIYISALSLTLWVILYFDGSSSMEPPSHSNQSNSPVHAGRSVSPEFHPNQQLPVPYYDEHGELVAIAYDEKIYAIETLIAGGLKPLGFHIPDMAYLNRVKGYVSPIGYFRNQIVVAIKWAGCLPLVKKLTAIQPEKNDLVLYPNAFTPFGMYREFEGQLRFYQFTFRN